MERNMSNDRTDPAGRERERDEKLDVLDTIAPSTTYKTRGKIDASSGTGVLGHNTATSGAAYQIVGENAPSSRSDRRE